jgi:ribosome biogenesis GTPase / thiamine phosphate phosphatase
MRRLFVYKMPPLQSLFQVAILIHMKEARVIQEHKTNFVIDAQGREYIATVRGSFFNEGTFPKVGDYVLYSEVADDKAVIEEVLPRTSTITRKAAETGEEQVIVANVDVVFIVMGLDGDFNLSRLERYLLLAKQGNVQPVVILNKSDIVEDIESYIDQVTQIVDGVPVYAVSAATGLNMESLLKHLEGDVTAVLLGSSGAGKSTITNWLVRGATQQVQPVRGDDSKGRHTTTFRQLFVLPKGGYLIDTPGMRELGVLSTQEDESAVFEQIETLAQQCRFANCDHDKSAGCAIVEAIEKGEISERQLNSYQKLQRERLFEESKQTKESSRDHKLKQKDMHKGYRAALKGKRMEDFE